MTFRIIPADAKGYPGATAIPLDGTRELVCRGVGPEVEAVLLKAKEERDHPV